MGSTTKKGNTANPGLQRAQEVPPPSFTVVTGPFELMVHGAATGALYLGWTPVECTLRVTNTPAADVSVILRNRDTAMGGQVVFRIGYATANQDTLALTLPADGSTVTFFVRGRFGSPSFHDQDGAISIHDATTNTVLHQRTLMVRIRKNANVLTIAERDRFLNAIAAINASNALYQVFVDSHTGAADPEIHGRPSFLVWHRAFVLSLERQLQAIDASVAMPYWRFDQTAPNVFASDFMGGTPGTADRVTFTGTNPLRVWSVNGGSAGIIRRASFDLTTGAANVIDETATLALGTNYVSFRTMEGNPHGSAHVSFDNGPINSIGTASQDPLFFMLHCNVDRLWAKWQLARNLWSAGDSDAYSSAGTVRPGDILTDTLWPWNGIASRISPPAAPGGSPTGSFPQLSFPSKPSPLITVGEVIDYIGRAQGNTNNFDYDDVPFV